MTISGVSAPLRVSCHCFATSGAAVALGRRLSGADATSKAVALATAYVKIAKDFTLSDVDAIGLGTTHYELIEV